MRPLWLQRHRVVQAEALRALSQRSLLQYRSSKGALARAPEGVQGAAVAAACRRIAVLTNSTSRATLMKIVYFCRLPVAILPRRYCSTPSHTLSAPPPFIRFSACGIFPAHSHASPYQSHSHTCITARHALQSCRSHKQALGIFMRT